MFNKAVRWETTGAGGGRSHTRDRPRVCLLSFQRRVRRRAANFCPPCRIIPLREYKHVFRNHSVLKRHKREQNNAHLFLCRETNAAILLCRPPLPHPSSLCLSIAFLALACIFFLLSISLFSSSKKRSTFLQTCAILRRHKHKRSSVGDCF